MERADVGRAPGEEVRESRRDLGMGVERALQRHLHLRIAEERHPHLAEVVGIEGTRVAIDDRPGRRFVGAEVSRHALHEAAASRGFGLRVDVEPHLLARRAREQRYAGSYARGER